MRKTNPLTKPRFKPQVSAAFASVSILIDADLVHPDQSPFQSPEASQGFVKATGDGEYFETSTKHFAIEIMLAPTVRESRVWRRIPQ
jgi:hypothetical protein